MVFGKLVQRHTARILGYGTERKWFWQFFDGKSFLIMVFMIAFGIGLSGQRTGAGGLHRRVLHRPGGLPADGGARFLLAVFPRVILKPCLYFFPSYCYNGREFNAHAVAAVPQNGEAGGTPAQSYLYCKRGRRCTSHWPSGAEKARRRRKRKPGDPLQSGSCVALRWRGAVYPGIRALLSREEGLFASKGDMGKLGSISRSGRGAAALRLHHRHLRRRRRRRGRPLPACWRGPRCPPCTSTPRRGCGWRRSCWSTPPGKAGPPARCAGRRRRSRRDRRRSSAPGWSAAPGRGSPLTAARGWAG